MADPKKIDIASGFPAPNPFGAEPDGDGVHFSIFSRNATRVWLALFDNENDLYPKFEIELDPDVNRTGDIWHLWMRGVGPGQLYLWRMDGPWDPEKGHRFDSEAYLLDPYAKALTGDFRWEEAKPKKGEQPMAVRFSTGDGTRGIPKCVVVSNRFDWEGDRPINRPLSKTIIYECHVRGLTQHESSGVRFPGTFAGVTEKIPYFKELGINAVELLPVHEFSVAQAVRKNPITGQPLTNYWGYNTVSFFAPNGRYSSSGNLGQQVDEFKWMVKQLHLHGIEVILDVVFNHTAEGNHRGPTLCFKGIDNSIYYLLDKDDGSYLDYSGTGNSMNCQHPVVRDFILSCLHYWVLHMHVDGFRFDLASVLGRDENGDLMANPPLLARINEDPVLRGTKIIAEAWDAAGAYQVGQFQGRWAEWNGRYRDDVRRFWRGEKAATGPFATRLTGSSDLYGNDGRTPHHSINFVTSHDGFTLNDWASYEQKHNEENGEDNRDGDNNNLSLNHGEEGNTQNPEIEKVRARQIKNMFANLMLSVGVPMMLGGDEFRRSQKGNNNAYCQDNEVSWFDWRLLASQKAMVRFAKHIIAFRKSHANLTREIFYTGQTGSCHNGPDLCWIGTLGQDPDWNGDKTAIGALIDGSSDPDEKGNFSDLYLLFNGQDRGTWFDVPPAPNNGQWHWAVNTGWDSPKDIFSEGKRPLFPGNKRVYLIPRSLVVLVAPKRSEGSEK